MTPLDEIRRQPAASIEPDGADQDQGALMIRYAIIGAAIVRQSYDRIAEGHGPPGPEEMARYMEDAMALADLCDEVMEANDESTEADDEPAGGGQ